MRRTIVEPAVVSGAALDDLKSWLGITRPNDDAQLLDLLTAALATCEAFTGQAALSQIVEERLPTYRGCTRLTSRPIKAVVAVEVMAQDGTRTALQPESYDLEIQSEGIGQLQLHREIVGQAVVVRVRTGIADNWIEVPGPLKQGIVRLCTSQYRGRDRAGETKSAAVPPASVSALWRPWRNVRLA